MFEAPTNTELEDIFQQKYGHAHPLGPGPSRRKSFGYYVPSDFYEALMKRLVKKSDAWLDLGGGRDLFPDNPRLSGELFHRCRRIVGIDPSPNILENPFVHERFQGFLEQYSGDRDFDIVSLRMVAEHISEPESLADELGRSMRADGLLVILTVWDRAPVTWVSRWTPHVLHHPIKKIFWGGDEQDTFPVEYKMNSPQKLRSIFENAGFTTHRIMLVGDCSVTSQWGGLNRLELQLWQLFHAFGITYPESCILAVFKKNGDRLASTNVRRT